MNKMTPQNFYATPGLMTNPGEYAPCFEGLPTDIPGLVKVVQGLMIHIFWAERYGLTLSQDRQAEVSLRPVDAKLRRLLELDGGPLTQARPLECKLVGNCRDHTVLMVSMLRHQGVPARGRCGFGTYFMPDHFEDHWVVEYWNAGQQRWVLVDAQLDAFQCQKLGVPFDTLDVPHDQFITGAAAWHMIRHGEANPDHFGIFEWHGSGFVRGNLIRDFEALNKVETLPWDIFNLMAARNEDLTENDLDLLDEVARLNEAGDEAFPRIRWLFENEPRLAAPTDWDALPHFPA